MEVRRILVDMDEVLCDFVEEACRMHGVSREQMERNRPEGHWSIQGAIGTVLERELSEPEFWRPITMAGEAFWATLGPLPWLAQLTRIVREASTDWHIITAPGECRTSYNGKVRWLKEKFGATFTQFAITPHKEIFAQPGVVLIDDREENIERFKAAGGSGILFPTKGNGLHGQAADPIPYVQQQLKERGRL